MGWGGLETLLINFKSTAPRFHGLINANLLYQRHLSSAYRNLCMSPAKRSIAGNISHRPAFLFFLFFGVFFPPLSITNSPTLSHPPLPTPSTLPTSHLRLFFSLNVLGIGVRAGEGRPISDNLLVHFAHLFPIMCNITSVIR